MAILGRGLENLPLSTDSLIIGVGGLVEELPVGTLNQVFTVTASGVDWADLPPLGATEFTGLNDTPANYTGASGLVVKVNVGETALEFAQIDGSEINNDLGWITQLEDDLSPKLVADLDADSFTVINLPNPVNSGDAVSKNYADDTFVELAGDTMTGFLTLNADPTLPLHAATKQYVDSVVVSPVIELDDLTDATISGPANGQVLTYNSGTNQWENQASGTGVTEFISLNDTPANYTSSAGLYVRVNSTPDALEFVQIAASEINNDEGWITSTLGAQLNAANFKITNLGTPTSLLDAVNKSYVDNKFVELAGDTMTGFLTLSADPTASLHAATKNYVDTEIEAAIQGLDIKDSVHVATTASLGASYMDNDITQGGQGDTLTATSVGTFTLDGVTAVGNIDPAADMVLGDRVLIKDQANPKTNGIYTITNMGSSTTLWELTRATDADNTPDGELTQGTFVFVEFGSTNQNTSWVATSTATGGVDPDNYYNINSLLGDDINFSIFSSSGTITAGDGLQKIGNVISAVGTASRISVSGSGIDIDTSYAGQTSIDTVGTVTTGTWEGDAVDNQRGAFGTSIATIGAKSLISRDASEISVGSANQVLTSNGTEYAAAYVNALRDTGGSATIIIDDNTAVNDRIVIADYTTLAAGDPDGALTPKGYVDAQVASVSSQDTWKNIILDDAFIAPTGPDTTLTFSGAEGLQTRGTGTSIEVDFDIAGLTIVTPENDDLMIISDDSDSGFTKAVSLQDVLEKAFLDLTDTPSAYAGEAGKYVRVNATPDGLEFTDAVAESGDNVSIFVNDAGYLVNIVEDTSPELGGDLDVLNSSIISSSNKDIKILPDGSGNILLDQLNWPTGVGTAGQVLTTDGAGQLSFTTVSGGTQNLWETIAADTGSTIASNATDTLIISGGTGITTSIASDTLTITNDSPNVDQNIWLTVAGDSGSTAANTTSDTLTIEGGTGISTAMSGDTLTITNDSVNADQNVWVTFNADSGSTSADSTTDSFTFTSGAGISTSISGDIITITNTAPVTTQISDITGESIGDLSDVTLTSEATGEVLQYNGSQWVNTTIASVGGVTNAQNVGAAGVGVFKTKTGSLLDFKNINAGSSKVTVTDDTGNDEIDIDIVPGNILTSTLNNDASFISNITGESLTSLNDVTTTSPTSTDLLQYNGSQWVNISTTDLANDLNLVDLNDVNITTGSGVDGYVITWDNGAGEFVLTQKDENAAGGTHMNIQYNNSGSFAGDANFNTDGSGSVDIAGDLDVDNINVDGNTISSTDTDGDIVLNPNGDGWVEHGGIFFSKRRTATLPDNTSVAATLFSYDAASFETVIVDYGIRRGGVGSKTGTLMIITDTIGVQITDTGAEINNAGITFTAIVNGSNIDVKYTTTDDVGDTDATMAYTIRRWNVL